MASGLLDLWLPPLLPLFLGLATAAVGVSMLDGLPYGLTHYKLRGYTLELMCAILAFPCVPSVLFGYFIVPPPDVPIDVL